MYQTASVNISRDKKSLLNSLEVSVVSHFILRLYSQMCGLKSIEMNSPCAIAPPDTAGTVHLPEMLLSFILMNNCNTSFALYLIYG